MGLLPVGREVEQRGRRRAAGEGAVVADIGPEPRGLRPAARQQRHRRVVAVEPLGRQHMGPDQRMDRLQRHRAGADLVGQRREAEVDAFAGIALGLPVQRLMLPELLEEDRRQQVRSGPAPRRGMEGRRRLADLLAVPAGELLAHGLDHLPLAWHHLQRLGDVLAHLHDARRAAAAAGGRRLDHHALAREMFGERLARRTAALEGAHRRGLAGRSAARTSSSAAAVSSSSSCSSICSISRARRSELPYCSRRSLAISSFSADHRLRGRNHRTRLRQLGLRTLARASAAASSARSRAISAAPSDMADIYHAAPPANQRNSAIGAVYPAFAGRCVQRGLRQSIPSSR